MIRLAAILAAVASLLMLVAVADSHSPQAWTVPPSAIHAITTASSPPERATPTVNRLPRGIGAEADHEAPTAPTMAVLATARPAASHSLAELVRVGTASFYDAGPGMYAALPGPWRAGRWVQVCGPAKCVTAPVVTSCVCGTHVIDLSPSLGEAVAGMNTAERWRYGVTPVSLVIEGGKP